MPIYEITAEEIRPLRQTTYQEVGIKERADLQRLLRSQISVIAPDTLVICEEFCEWEDSRRRIDLLAIDKAGNLVVIELKCTEDGGHMELQAVRYAGMVAGMTFEKAVAVYAKYLSARGVQADARSRILEFLEWEEADEDKFAQDVRIVLVSADFSKEITTAVMWLNDRKLDIRCMRVRPYLDGNRVLVDVQQVIPLPEAADYIVRIREKEEQERTSRREQTAFQQNLVLFWARLLDRAKGKTDLHSNVSPKADYRLSAGAGVSGLSFDYCLGLQQGRVELYIDTGDKARNKRLFDLLYQNREQIEARFGSPLLWKRLDERIASKVESPVPVSIAEEENWRELQDALIDGMVRLERAFRPEVQALRHPS